MYLVNCHRNERRDSDHAQSSLGVLIAVTSGACPSRERGVRKVAPEHSSAVLPEDSEAEGLHRQKRLYQAFPGARDEGNRCHWAGRIGIL